MPVEETGSKALRVDEPGSKALVRAVEELDVELRAPSLMLHLAMWSVGAHHAVMHVRAKGKLACVATASAASACGASLLDGARESATAAIQALAARAMKRGAGIALSHGEAKQLGLAHGSALAMPLLPPEGDALGCITLASDDDARVWSPEEQRLVKHATPMFALYAQRALLREQAALLSALTPAEEREGRVIAARIEKATGELKSAHARQIEELMEEHNVSRRYSAELHKQAAEQRALVDELRAQINRLEDEARVRTRRSDEQEREIERLDEMRKAQLAQLSQAHAAELSDARREGVAVPAAAAVAETAEASGPPRGHHEVVTRPPPRQGASVVSSAAVRMLPEIDVPKSSRSVALPPLPSNWERKVYADGKVHVLIESFPADEDADADADEGYIFHVESAQFHELKFDVDFDGSLNYDLAPAACSKAAGLKGASIVAGPYERKEVARLTLSDPYEPSAFTYKMSWTTGPPPREAIDKRAAERGKAMRDRIGAAEALLDECDDDETEVCASLQRGGEDGGEGGGVGGVTRGGSFIDVSFPPLVTSVEAQDVASAAEGSQAAPLSELAASCAWRRPSDFLDVTPAVFEGGIHPGDVCQPWGEGEGEHTHAPLGRYELRLCKHGQWARVSVDDYLPCRPADGEGPVFSKAKGAELWVVLLEKAYAKLHGSYLALRSGMCRDALTDLTGAPSLYAKCKAADGAPGVTFEMLQRYDRNNCLICCSTPGEDNLTETGAERPSGGLVPGHAYTLISARRLECGVELLKIRNPWGTFEWEGAWSDHSKEMTDAVRQELDAKEDDGEVEVAADDGAFWMCYADFLNHFVSVTVCYAHVPQPGRALPNTKMAPTPWRPELETRLKSSFTSPSGGGALRPTHLFEIVVGPADAKAEDAEVTVLLGMHQVDERCPAAPPYLDIGVAVMRADSGTAPSATGTGPKQTVGSLGSAVQRSALLELHLRPGKYLVVPTSSGSLPTPPEGSGAPGWRLDDRGRLPPYARHALSHALFALDADVDGAISLAAIRSPDAAPLVSALAVHDVDLVEIIERAPHGRLATAKLIRATERALVAATADAADAARAAWVEIFAACGYDADLRPLQTRNRHPYVISAHATSPVELSARGVDEGTLSGVQAAVVRDGGTAMSVGKSLRIFALASEGGVSFAAENSDPERRAELTLDCSSSENVRASDGAGLCVTNVLAPSELRMLLVLLPADRFEPWTYAYKVAAKMKRAPKAKPPPPAVAPGAEGEVPAAARDVDTPAPPAPAPARSKVPMRKLTR